MSSEPASIRVRGAAPAAVVVVALSLAVSGCLFHPETEAEVGADEARKVEETMGLVRDPELQRYLEKVGKRLAAVSDRPGVPYRFMILDMEVPNAFALPGGYIYVSRGLLALANSEDELACVLGHEIGHVTGRHAASRVTLATPFALLIGIPSAAVGIVSPLLGGVLASTGQALAGGLVLAPFSREQENAADQIGQALAARAGYDPAALAAFLEQLGRENELYTGEKREFFFLDTHPMTPDRVRRTSERAASLERAPARPVARSHADFLARIDGVIVGPDPYQGLFRDSLFLHPHYDFAIAFPTGWETENTAVAVGAVAPSQDALSALRFVPGETRVAVVTKKVKEQQKDLEITEIRISGLPAARAKFTTRTNQGPQAFHITWIEYGGHVYQLVGVSAEKSASQYAKIFDETARSFRPLRRDERSSIEEERLRIRSARAGETPAEIAKRTGTSWEPARIAVTNGVPDDARFQSGQLVKLAIPQPYTPRED